MPVFNRNPKKRGRVSGNENQIQASAKNQQPIYRRFTEVYSPFTEIYRQSTSILQRSTGDQQKSTGILQGLTANQQKSTGFNGFFTGKYTF